MQGALLHWVVGYPPLPSNFVISAEQEKIANENKKQNGSQHKRGRLYRSCQGIAASREGSLQANGTAWNASIDI